MNESFDPNDPNVGAAFSAETPAMGEPSAPEGNTPATPESAAQPTPEAPTPEQPGIDYAAAAAAPPAGDMGAGIPQQPPVDNAYVEAGATPFTEPAAETQPQQAEDAQHPAAEHLFNIEKLCLQWGGEIGAEIRTLVGKVRDLL